MQSPQKYTSSVILIASLIVLVAGFAIYTYASPTLTLEQIETRRIAQMLQAQTQVDMDNLHTLSDCHDLAESQAKYPEQYLELRETCYKKGKKPDIVSDKVSKLYSGTASGAIVPPPPVGYTKKHALILTGSHSYVQYSDRKGASWKNNNPSGLTWGVSEELKSLWSQSGIRYKKGSLRPANEKGNYIYFETVEEGLRAKIIAIRERWGKATVAQYLAGWGTDYLELSFEKSKIIRELSEDEFAELFVQQLKKESPGLISQIVMDSILIVI